MLNAADIANGVREERLAADRFIDFKIESKRQERALWIITIAFDSRHKNELDESLEGAAVWWGGKPAGTADVLSIIPDELQINLRYASKAPPDKGELIRIYLPQYLEKLEEIWTDDSRAEECVKWFQRVKSNIRPDPSKRLPVNQFQWLRSCQQNAFSLPSYSISFLHGPPGTGKTRTLGALVAQYLSKFPSENVLLLSTTNLAVDEALVSADNALKEINAEKIRNKCKRFGNHFVASKYDGRKHLIPSQDEKLLRQLVEKEASRPDEKDIHKYAAWKSDVERLRSKLKTHSETILRSSRLVAMTTTRAVFTLDVIREHFSAGLIVFDESSQVGIAHALALAPLGRRVVFAGDPEQLAPIFKAEVEDARDWMGRSMFEFTSSFGDASCFLDEQSRMAKDICAIVSSTFYRSKLKVAGKCGVRWHQERKISDSKVEKNAVSVVPIASSGGWNGFAGGLQRQESAAIIAKYVADFMNKDRMNPADLLVLTPFRAQRKKIKYELKARGIKGVKVSTVHRAQGSECHTVIFDPVDGSSKFLLDEDAPGRRLVNVALSRAKARLILLLSARDCTNPLFQRIHNAISNVSVMDQSVPRPSNDPESLKIILHPNFPNNAMGKEISCGIKRGRITEIVDGGKKFRMFLSSGTESLFKTENVVENAKKLL